MIRDQRGRVRYGGLHIGRWRCERCCLRLGNQGNSCWEGDRRKRWGNICGGNSISKRGNSHCKGPKTGICTWYAQGILSKPVWLKYNEQHRAKLIRLFPSVLPSPSINLPSTSPPSPPSPLLLIIKTTKMLLCYYHYCYHFTWLLL